ncbi:TonB-dependent receptor [Chromobacterium piscinae]|uniref:TonB-dependent receptor n=1 Tax=Chromobacterium piscinae TaxID=686831 RepID=UPI003207E5A7
MMNYKRKALAVALSLIGSVGYMPSAHADSDSSGTLDRVEITGSNIKRSISKETAVPMTIIKTDDLVKQGLTSVEQVVNSLAANQSTQGANAAVGASTGGASYASLRGLGHQYTLILLDGRRIVNQPMDGTSVDLNAIPLSVIDRVEVVRDGASAIYGTDAIGGVINFITKKTMTGLSIGGEFVSPQRSGGKEKSVNISYGYGDLGKDGFNIYGAYDYHKTEKIMATDRDFASTITSSTKRSVNSFPANYLNSKGDLVAANPACKPPYSIPDGSGACSELYSLFPSIQPEVEQQTAVLKGTTRLGDHELSLQYMITKTKNTTWVAPTPFSGDVTSPTAPGENPANGPFPLYGRSVPAGDRVDSSTATTQRLQLNAEGLIAGWDYRAGLGYSESKVTHDVVSGYLSQSKLQNALNNGFNPDTVDPAAWAPYASTGQIEQAKSKLDLADFKVSKEVYQLPAGMLAVALGIEARHETIEHTYNHAVASDTLSTGLTKTTDGSGARNAQALYAEMDIPVIKHLDANLAVRYDHYSDSGSSVNPKVSLKYQPIPQLLLRTSASTGFRAPSLYDINQPNQQQLTAKNYTDPVLCPGGVAQPGAGSNSCVKTQQNLFVGGNKSLNPEKSSSLSFGMVLEPVKDLTASVDFWWTNIQNTIGSLNEATIFGNPSKYGNLFVRDGSNNLLYVMDATQNLGNTSAAGVDLGFSYRFPRTAIGTFSVNLDGTYISKHMFQYEKGGDYHSDLGAYVNGGPTFRWQHNLSLNWSEGAWSGILAQDYKSGYTDDVATHMVKPYSTWNLSGSYAWDKKLTLTVGVRNLFDQLPPWSNQGDTTPQGYDPRFTDAVGRAYFLKANYKM